MAGEYTLRQFCSLTDDELQEVDVLFFEEDFTPLEAFHNYTFVFEILPENEIPNENVIYIEIKNTKLKYTVLSTGSLEDSFKKTTGFIDLPIGPESNIWRFIDDHNNKNQIVNLIADRGHGKLNTRTFISCLKKCVNLTSLSLENISLESLNTHSIEMLMNALIACDKLERLGISGNDFSRLTVGSLATLANGFAQCRNLKKLNIDANNIGKLDAAQVSALVDGLTRCNNLQVLEIDSNKLEQFNETCFEIFARGFHRYSRLQELVISQSGINMLDKTKLEFLALELARCDNLNHLDITEGVNTIQNAEVLDILIPRLKQCKNLTRLSILNTSLFINNQNMPANNVMKYLLNIVGVYQQCSNLSDLSITYIPFYNLSESNILEFSEALAKCKNLTAIDISRTVPSQTTLFNPRSIKMLCDGLMKCSNLQKLSLPDILSAHPAESKTTMLLALAAGLKACHKLKTLRFSYSAFTDEMINVLYRAINEARLEAKAANIYFSNTPFVDNPNLIDIISSYSCGTNNPMLCEITCNNRVIPAPIEFDELEFKNRVEAQQIAAQQASANALAVAQQLEANKRKQAAEPTDEAAAPARPSKTCKTDPEPSEATEQPKRGNDEEAQASEAVRKRHRVGSN